jgi:putative pyruvate formate lyase activating enzyme
MTIRDERRTTNNERLSEKLTAVQKINEILKDSLKKCRICPRLCGVDRTKGKLGYCRSGSEPMVYSYVPHHGEEPPISGDRGSGTIFFSHCNMKCVYCQNYQFSQLDEGTIISVDKLAQYMLKLQNNGCHNINLVTPTHYMPQIMAALQIALEGGLDIPIVYNTSGYELPEMIRLLDGVVDIYLPDMRYSNDETAKLYSDAPDYVTRDRESVKEMFDQVGDLKMTDDGIALKGMIIRLLALPNDISGTAENLKFIRDNLSSRTYLSIMSQYYPTHKAHGYKEISRRITTSEYKIIVDEAHLLGLNNGWIQEPPENMNESFLGTNIKPKT